TTKHATPKLPHPLPNTLAQAAPQLLPYPKAQKTITSALGSVKTAVDDLDTAVKAINSTDPTALTPLATKCTAIGDNIRSATTTIQGAHSVDLSGALALQKCASGLTDSLNSHSTDSTAKKPIVDMAGLSSTVATLIQMQQSMNGALVKAVTDKVPAPAQGLAGQTSQGVNVALQKVVTAYGMPAAANMTVRRG
ncbi:hypothetical protein LTS18_003595, partial [Coniosporium uncinatum]